MTRGSVPRRIVDAWRIIEQQPGGAARTSAGAAVRRVLGRALATIALEATGPAVADGTADMAESVSKDCPGRRALRAKDAEHLKTRALVEVTNEVSGGNGEGLCPAPAATGPAVAEDVSGLTLRTLPAP